MARGNARTRTIEAAAKAKIRANNPYPSELASNAIAGPSDENNVVMAKTMTAYPPAKKQTTIDLGPGYQCPSDVKSRQVHAPMEKQNSEMTAILPMTSPGGEYPGPWAPTWRTIPCGSSGVSSR
ncbi:hypothetical protein AUR04nite_28760 [Glutamicibacter uratoxydans]|uniref:Uncharacterized protein n=1 Tax=Glutamicibacter uratoxydans TaxID=43667 RepID=A0A4Y4DTX6_GLUUR|nr:hypothetical protein AUR04nite_28760 [Glutamicibacter uratoxydans]